MMFEKGKRERRNSEEDRVFNRMLLWLAGAVAVELLMLLLQQAYVVMRWGGPVAKALLTFFEVFSIAGAVIAAGCAAWAVAFARKGKPILLPSAIGGAAALKMAYDEAEGNKTDPANTYVNAHGTSTPLNDSSETLAIKKGLGEEAARKCMVSST